MLPSKQPPIQTKNNNMKQFFTLVVGSAVALLTTNNSFAQQPEDFTFQFSYRLDSNLYKYAITPYMDTAQLRDDILNEYMLNRRDSRMELYWSAAASKSGNDSTTYYNVYEIGYPEHYDILTVHFYDKNGKWLYTLSDQFTLPKKLKKKAALHRKHYLSSTGYNYPDEIYSVRDASGKQYYMIDYNDDLNPKYQPKEQEYAAYGEYKLRLITDKNMNIIREIMLFGDGSELRELQFAAPLQLPR